MNIVLGSNYESIVSETKKLADKTADLRNKLAQIRSKLDDAYDGQIDYNSEIKAIEKRLYIRQVQMSRISSAVNDAFDGLLTVDSQSIEIDNGLKAILEVTKITSSDTFKEISSGVKSIVAKYKDSKWADIISSVIPPIGAGGVVIGGAVSVGRIVADVISDAVITTPDEFEDKHPEEAREVEIERKLDALETITQKPSQCTTYAVVNLLRRKQIIDGGEATVTGEEVRKYNYVKGKGYYWKTNCCQYSMKYENASSVKSKVTNTYTDYITQLLDKRPEGIVLYAKHDTNNHAITITNYEIVDNKVQFYVMDPSNSGTKRKLEDSALFSSYSKGQNMNAEKIFSTKMLNLYYVK